MDISSAIQAHKDWINRLKGLLDGTNTEPIDSAKLGRDDTCVLGKWLHAEGHASYGSDPTFKQLMDAHAEFHRVASGLVTRHATGESISHAELEFPSFPLRRASREVERLLLDLRDKHDIVSSAL